MKTILIVDDDPVSVRLLEMIVRRHGYDIESAGSAAAAMAYIQSGQPLDLVIADQNLGGESGLELAARLSGDSRFRSVPVILCTGVADRTLVEQAIKQGVRHFIVKPISPEVVMEKIAAVESERSSAMESRAAIMTRLRLTDYEYKTLIATSRQHLSNLRAELAAAHDAGDRVEVVAIAGRLRETAGQLGAARLAAALDRLELSRTWREFGESVAAVLLDVEAVEVALEEESKPRLVGRPLGPGGGI